MLYREIIAVCSQIHTEHTRFFNVKADSTYSNLYDFTGKRVTAAAPASPVPIQPQQYYPPQTAARSALFSSTPRSETRVP